MGAGSDEAEPTEAMIECLGDVQPGWRGKGPSARLGRQDPGATSRAEKSVDHLGAVAQIARDELGVLHAVVAEPFLPRHVTPTSVITSMVAAVVLDN
jgi:hypothetical protein